MSVIYSRCVNMYVKAPRIFFFFFYPTVFRIFPIGMFSGFLLMQTL